MAYDRVSAHLQEKKSEALLTDMAHLAVVGGWEFEIVPPEHLCAELEQVWTDEAYLIRSK
jgi:hypothetical protein